MEDEKIEKLVKEVALVVNQSTKQENSNLIADMKSSHTAILTFLGEIKNSTEGINKRLDTLNSSVAKHEMRLASQDVLNAQMTITQQSLTEDSKTLKNEAKESNNFRVGFTSSLNTIKWLLGFVGIGNAILFLKFMGVF